MEIASRVAKFKETIFATISAKANELGALNLGQGFPNFDGPIWLKEAFKQALEEGHNQYPPSPGFLDLREEIARTYSHFYGLTYNPKSEITITNGATEAIFSSLLGLIDPGDEVIVFEPFYDSYVASIEMAGGIAKPVTLRAPNFAYDEVEIESQISPKTKLIIVNSPHNPTGKIMRRAEGEMLSKLAIKHNLLVMSDEVYEHLLYDDHKHIPLATFEGMQERTLTVSSMGKTFGVTGWKVGWVCAPEHLTHGVRMVHQFNSFSVSSAAQKAFTEGLKRLDAYLPEFRSLYQGKRDLFISGLQKKGYDPIVPEGSYFVMLPIDKLTDKPDTEFAFELMETKNIASIPPSVFYLKSDEGKKYLRLCFAKTDELLKAALEKF